MEDVWLGPGGTYADLEMCLEALSLREKNMPPLIAVAIDEQRPRLVLASRALIRYFGEDTAEALSSRLLDGPDPGARRLSALCRGLTIESAPHLERLQFSLGSGTEIVTCLCRHIPAPNGSLFVAAALGIQPSLIHDRWTRLADTLAAPSPAPAPITSQDVAPKSPSAEPPLVPSAIPMASMDVQTIQATLRARWPASRTVRFLWQSDADLVCTQVTPPLAEIVGVNADIVGRDLLELAPQLDPTGRLGEALRSRRTWSGIDISWPLADAPVGVAVGLGAIPVRDRDKEFDGYRGYGVVHLDRIEARSPLRLVAEIEPPGSQAVEPENPSDTTTASKPPANVVRFPGARALSDDDQKAFATLGAELREETGLKAGPQPLQPATPIAAADAALSAPGVVAIDRRAEEVARHGLAILDRLAVGLLVSRDNIPIFANRHLLDMLGFADEDDLHEAGGMSRLFGDQPGNTTGSEAIGARGRDGRIIATQTRVQTIDWDGLPASLLTLLPIPPAKDREPSAPPPQPSLDDEDAEIREMRAILETATDGVAVIDADCNVLSLNRSGEALFGCDRGSVIGKPFLSLFAANNQGLAADYLDGIKSNPTKRLLNDGRELLINAQRGGTIPVFMTLGRLEANGVFPEKAAGGRFCALFRDLTHWKKVERDLEAARQDAERANDLKSDFLTNVGHEIRTPLNAIIGFAEMMMEERFGPIGNERYKDYLRDIHGSGTHVVSLVNDLLDLSKIEAGKLELAIEPIDANKVIGECVALMQPEASRERVIMRQSLAANLPQIKADARSLRQIVLNILSNAVKFNEPGGQVIVATTRTEAGHVVIRVRDTGPGMSEDDIAAALQPFRRLADRQGADRPATAGTGLGLPLTKALVEANEAGFAIRSKREQGTLVEVAFPPARVLAG